VILVCAALTVWFSNATTRSGRAQILRRWRVQCLVGKVAEVDAEVLAFLVTKRLQPVAQTVERRRHVVEPNVKSGDTDEVLERASAVRQRPVAEIAPAHVHAIEHHHDRRRCRLEVGVEGADLAVEDQRARPSRRIALAMSGTRLV
jgi:hypothetical protein